MSTSKILPPLTAVDGFEIRDGVAVSHIGEDGAVVALGQNGAHLPRERVYEAVRQIHFFGPDLASTVDDLEERWAIAFPCDGEFCEGECSWHLQWSNELNDIGPETPNAFPITVLPA